MHQTFEVFGLTLKAYSVMAYIAALAAAVLVWPSLRRAGLSPLRALALLLGMCAAFLVGARLWNVAVSPGNYTGSLKWWSPRMAGLSLYGGLLGAAAVLFALVLKWRRSVPRVLDGFVLPVGAAFCIARVGCFLNGCCAGKETDGPFGVVFPAQTKTVQLGLLGTYTIEKTVHPTQLYELAGALIGVPLAILLAKKLKLHDGARFLIYGTWFCAVRLAVLPLRELSYGDAVTKIVYPAIYLALIALGIVLLAVRERKRPAREEEQK